MKFISGRTFRARKALMMATVSGATLFQFGSCNLADFTTTTTTTFSGREVVQFLVRSAILTPIQTFLDDRINGIFDDLEEEPG